MTTTSSEQPVGESLFPAAKNPIPLARRSLHNPQTRFIAGAIAWILGVVVLTLTVTGSVAADFIVMGSIYAVIAMGYDVSVGMCGELNFGVNGFVLVGAYGAGLLSLHGVANPVIGALVAVAVGAALAGAMSLIASRVREFYFAVLTLAVGLLVQQVATVWTSVTGGETGLSDIPGIGSSTLIAPAYNYWLPLALGSVGVVLFLCLFLKRSGMGHMWRTIARDENLAMAFGIPVARYRSYALIVSGAAAGLGGFLMVRYIGFVVPDTFSLGLVVSLFVMVCLGGRGSIWGPLIGAFVVYAIQRGLESQANWSPIVLAGVLVIVLASFPDGIAGGVTHLTTRARAHGFRDRITDGAR